MASRRSARNRHQEAPEQDELQNPDTYIEVARSNKKLKIATSHTKECTGPERQATNLAIGMGNDLQSQAQSKSGNYILLSVPPEILGMILKNVRT
jgi:hypothetical protein